MIVNPDGDVVAVETARNVHIMHGFKTVIAVLAMFEKGRPDFILWAQSSIV